MKKNKNSPAIKERVENYKGFAKLNKGEKVFKTQNIILKRSVKVDHKTTIFIKQDDHRSDHQIKEDFKQKYLTK